MRLVFTPFRASVERHDLSTCVCRHMVCKTCNKLITCDTGLIFTAAATAHRQRRTLNLVMRTLAHLWPQQPDHQLEDDEAQGDHDQGSPEPMQEQIAKVAEATIDAEAKSKLQHNLFVCSTRVTLLPVPYQRHHSLHGAVHHIYRWLSDVLISSQVLHATQQKCVGQPRDHGRVVGRKNEDGSARCGCGCCCCCCWPAVAVA